MLRTGSPRERTGFEAERSTVRWIALEKAVSEPHLTLRFSVSLAACLYVRQVGKQYGGMMVRRSRALGHLVVVTVGRSEHSRFAGHPLASTGRYRPGTHRPKTLPIQRCPLRDSPCYMIPRPRATWCRSRPRPPNARSVSRNNGLYQCLVWTFLDRKLVVEHTCVSSAAERHMNTATRLEVAEDKQAKDHQRARAASQRSQT